MPTVNGLSITFFNTQDKSSQALPLEAILSYLEGEQGFFWCDIENEDIGALNYVLQTLDIECIWVDAFGKPDVLPHLRDIPAAISFYLYDVTNTQSHLDSTKDIAEMEHESLLLILGKRFVITYHPRPLDVIEVVKRDIHANFQLAGKTPAFVVFLLAQYCLYNYARLNLANDNFLDLIELDLLAGRESEYITKVSISGYNILTLKKLNGNLHLILLMLVTKRSYVVSEDARESLHHMLTDTLGIRASIDSSRDLLDSVITSSGAMESRKTAQIVQVLTIVSAVFLPLTLIAGIYGMNFTVIPELHWKYGYYYALGLMITVAGCFMGLLHHFGWLFQKHKPKKHRNRVRHTRAK